MLHVIYRSYGGENRKPRPDYYSKRLALVSLIQSFLQVGRANAELIFLNDGPIPSDLIKVMTKHGEVIAHDKLGLRGSFAAALELPLVRKWSVNDLVWLSEDDYLYQPVALKALLAAADAFPDADYFGLYALIGSRLPSGGVFDDAARVPKRWRETTSKQVLGHRWCSALSTTSTFGARVGILEADRGMMLRAMTSGGAWDHTASLMYQGYQPYPLGSLLSGLRDPAGAQPLRRRAGAFAVRAGLNVYQTLRNAGLARRRRLVTADPPLITHLETAYMAVGSDWEALARNTQKLTIADV